MTEALTSIPTTLWGPTGLPSKFSDVPYAAFSKSERIGRVADWAQPTQQSKQYKDRPQQAQSTGPFSFAHEDEDDDAFHVVENKPTQKPKQYKSNTQTHPQHRRNERKEHTHNKAKPTNRKWHESKTHLRVASVEIKPEWKLCDTISFSDLQKLNLEHTPVAVNLKDVGSVRYYDKTYDRGLKPARALKKMDTPAPAKTTTSDDPIIRDFSQKKEANVFATDSILAALMAAPRSVLSWDIVITKVGDNIFLDKRDDSQFDLLTVGETAPEPPSEEKDVPNSAYSLALEATTINNAFSKQVLQPKNLNLGQKAPGAYRYRKFELDDDTVVICRCEVDGIIEGASPKDYQYVSIKALNEWETKNSLNWRKKLDSSRGGVLATEIRNNSYKFGKWGAMSILSGVEQIRLGYVSRVLNRTPTVNHEILDVQLFKAVDFATQMSLNIKNMWAILKYFVNAVREDEGTRFVILKNPVKPSLALYSVPPESFNDAASAASSNP